ncbi:MAG: hypothetical protein ACE15F_05600 [bacterium]
MKQKSSQTPTKQSLKAKPPKMAADTGSDQPSWDAANPTDIRPLREEDELPVDETMIRLLTILLPRMKTVFLVSCLAAAAVGGYLFLLTPREYVCKAVIAPDVMRDLTSIDLIQLKSADTETLSLPFASQLSQIRTLAESSQVKRGILEKADLLNRWECQDERECLDKLGAVYIVREIRQVGLEIQAVTPDPNLSTLIVDSSIKETNGYFKNMMKTRAEESILQIKKWIDDVTQAIQATSSDYIHFASQNNITDLENQFTAGTALLGKLKQDILTAENELTRKREEFGEENVQLIPLQKTLEAMRESLQKLLEGKDKDGVFPALSDYENLKFKVDDYQQQLAMLRSRAELFNKQLAAAQIEAQKQARSIMILDEPFVEPASKGTVKFSILTFIGAFLFTGFFLVMKEYWKSLREFIKT